MKAAKFHSDGFRAIFVQGRHTLYEDPSRIQGESALVVPIPFDQTRYDHLGPDEHHELFIGMYLEGIEKAHRQFPIPYDVLMQGIEEFRRGGYKNEWLFKRRLLKPLGLHASLLCDIDVNRFRLTLKIERKGNVVFEQPILETNPDEICFAHQVKDVVLEGDQIIVKGSITRPTCVLDVESLG